MEWPAAVMCQVAREYQPYIDALDGWTLGLNGKFVSWALYLCVVRVI